MAESNSFSQMVVIGSSAGGIEALSTLVHMLPADLPAPIVLAQHLDPSRESRLAEILSHTTSLPVRTLTEHERLLPGVVYVVPANRDVEITDHDIRLLAGTHRNRPSIDHLFSSAAGVFGENLIAVVLTGTGNDGAAGALEVRGSGGTVIIQDPSTASFPGLPRSLAPSTVDFVAPLEEIAALLQRLLAGWVPSDGPDVVDGLEQLLRVLRDRHGIDFRTYKRATVLRRVQRRMAATGSADIVAYLQHVQARPEEQNALIASLLIKVTKFFRDADLFEALRTRVLPDIVETAMSRDRAIRIWSAGCATGEEAYSLAIQLAETLGDDLEQFHIRIFATDLDAAAIAFARQGLYPASSLSGVDEKIVSRYFDVVDGSYEISKRIRALMVFGQHDLADRAPFPRVDLVLCRNVLIYFTTDLQRRILQLFAFSLRDAGYLILGKSETSTPFADAFAADDPRLKIYRRHGDRSVVPLAPVRDVTPPDSQRVVTTRPAPYRRSLAPQSGSAHEPSLGPRADAILFDLPVGIVVVDRRYDIQYINDAARTFLDIRSSALGEDLIHLVQTVPSAELRALIDRALEEGKPAVGILDAVDGSSDTTRHLEIACTATSGNDASTRVTVCVSDGTQHVAEILRLEGELGQAREGEQRADRRRLHLVETNRELLSANQELTRDIAELRSQNEEFLVGNEELQAATEEVETLNEELQATNEELETLNEELQATVEELNTTNDDLQARNLEIQDLAIRHEASRVLAQEVLNTVDDAVVMIDRDGSIIVTNSQFDRLFPVPLGSTEIRDADGRPLPEAEQPQQRVARGEAFATTCSIMTGDGPRRYRFTGRPLGGNREEGGGVLLIRELPKV